MLSGRTADPGRSARHEGDLPGEWAGRSALGEFRLLKTPVLHVEQVLLAHRMESPRRLGVEHHLRRASQDVPGDARVGERATQCQRTESGHQDHARRGVEHRERAMGARGTAGEVITVPARVLGDGALACGGDRTTVGVGREVEPHGTRLGADHMIRRHGAARGDRARGGLREQREDRRVGAPLKDEAPRARARDRASKSRCHGGATAFDVWRGHRRDRGGTCSRGGGSCVDRRPRVRTPRLGRSHAGDHPLVALLGGLAPCEDPMLLEDESVLAAEITSEFHHAPREREARHHVRDEEERVAPDLRGQCLRIGLIL